MIYTPMAASCKKGCAKEVIKSNAWTSLSEDKAPYKFSATVVIENLPSSKIEMFELFNDNPVLFSKYAFAIADAKLTTEKVEVMRNKFSYKSHATLTIYAIEQPVQDVELTIAVEL